ncbi:hypothetical protein IDJ77_01015 [Mucilaginibacter sp. ZT4R22]|uniref:DUF304 domain-containing protein n=1 Tax=Mucilaginibacter pankratovii TaxID=2772110 RepID=A0ABR7WJA1_9SPHI|nr:hypothetical protein [Mucilaginibacter pankratovii]MBD1362375.1 hypothetical protein [Mucilaginibacter pankratovii]
MTEEIFNRSIETQELQLVGLENKLTHYGIVAFLLIIPLVLMVLHSIDYFNSGSTDYKDGEVWFLFLPSVLAVIFYFIQKKRLKFKIVKTSLNAEQLKGIINEVAKDLKWVRMSSSTKTYIAKTLPGFFSGSWGEQITVLFYNDTVLINSICDPDRRPSVVSMGRNRENENTLADKINEANNKLKRAPDLH